jgi:hypothetical protein
MYEPAFSHQFSTIPSSSTTDEYWPERRVIRQPDYVCSLAPFATILHFTSFEIVWLIGCLVG